MFNKTQLSQTLTHSMHTKAALLDDTKAAFLKQQIVANLNRGDLIEGTLIQGEDNKLYLSLDKGVRIPVQMEGRQLLNTLLLLSVEGTEEGIIQLKPYQEDASIGERVIKTLDLPNNNEMKACVDAFMTQELPLDKSLLMKGYTLEKTTHLPYTVLAKLIDKLGGEAAKKLLDTLHMQPKDLVDKHQVLLNQCLGIEEGGTDKVPSQNRLVWTQQMTSRLPVDKALSLAKEVQQIVQSHKQSVVPSLQEGVGQHQQQGQAQSIQTMDQLYQRLGGDEVFLRTYTEKLYETLFKFDRSTVTKGMQHQDSPKNLPLYEAYAHLEQSLEATKDMQLTPALEEEVVYAKEQLTTLQKVSVEAQYFAYPFENSKNREDAVVYFYSKKNKQPKDKTKQYLAVIMLDMPALDHVELHVGQQAKQLEITVFVADEARQHYVQKHLQKLGERLEVLDYQLAKCACYVKDTPRLQKAVQQPYQNQGIDFRV